MRAVFHLPAPARALHGGVTIRRYRRTHFLGVLFPATGGMLLFGWRAVLVMGLVVAAAWVAGHIWRGVGTRGRELDLGQIAYLGVLLGLMLPAHLATAAPDAAGYVVWPIAVAGGGLLVVLVWGFGGAGVGRLHPAVFVYLILAGVFPAAMTPHGVLQREKIAAGDMTKGSAAVASYPGPEAWVTRPTVPGVDAVWGDAPARGLIEYTTARMRPARGRIPLHELLRDRMPPLEDLIVGGQPGPIGVASALGVIIGGLFLLYRGLIDFRVPLLTVTGALVALLVLPMPTVIREDGAYFRWLAMRQPDVRLETALTFVSYEIMASPLLFTAFFLATSPNVRPMARRARAMYGCLLGVLCAAFQLYVSVAVGPYLALVLVGLFSPTLDRWFKPKPLV